MYRGSYNNNQVTNGPPPPHQHHQLHQSSDAYGQQSYYQAQQPGEGQYGGQPTGGTVSHGEYPYQGTHHHQQHQGYPPRAHLAGGTGGGSHGVGHSNAAAPNPGLSTDAYASYGPPPPPSQQHDQYQYINPPKAATVLSGLHPPRQLQRQHEELAPSPVYNQSIPAPVHTSNARMDSSLPQHYQQQQQQQNYPAIPHPQHREQPAYPAPHHPHAAAAAAAAIPPPVPMHRALEDPMHQYPQSGHGYGHGYSQHRPPAPAPLPVQHQLPQQQHQYTRYEPEYPTSARIARMRERGGGPEGQYALETRKAHSYNSTGGGGGGGRRHPKKKSRKNIAATAPAVITATSTHDKEKRNRSRKHHRSSRSPAPTDSQILLSPADEQEMGPNGTATDTQYAVHLPAYQLAATPSMDYVEVSRRFDRLVMPKDFIEMIRPRQQQPAVVQQETAVLSTINSHGDEKSSSMNGLGLSGVLNLKESLPVHHEICTEKVENHSLALYDPDPLLTSSPPSPVTQIAPTATATATATAAAIPFSKELPVVYNAKVVLLSGLNEEDQHAILSKHSSASSPSTSGDSDHLSCRLKFVVARAERAGIKSGIFALGGRVDPTLDGNPDPSFSSTVDDESQNHSGEREKALMNAAKRHVLIQTGVDLSPCHRWIKVLEIKYYRPGIVETSKSESDLASNVNNKDAAREGSYFEVTVMFVVDDGYRAVLLKENWAAAWEKRHIQPRRVDNSSDESAETRENEEEKNDGAAVGDDCEEGELPETASPLLKTKKKPTNKVVQMPSEPRVLFIGLNNQKLRLKTMSISLDGLLDYNESDVEEATFELSLFAETMHEMLSRDAGITIYKALMQKPWEKEIVDRSDDGKEDQGVFFAFSYFDAGGLGYILTEDLQIIIESLGLHLHHGYVQELCQKAAEASGSSGKGVDGSCGGRIEYSKLCVRCPEGAKRS